VILHFSLIYQAFRVSRHLATPFMAWYENAEIKKGVLTSLD